MGGKISQLGASFKYNISLPLRWANNIQIKFKADIVIYFCTNIPSTSFRKAYLVTKNWMLTDWVMLLQLLSNGKCVVLAGTSETLNPFQVNTSAVLKSANTFPLFHNLLSLNKTLQICHKTIQTWSIHRIQNLTFQHSSRHPYSSSGHILQDPLTSFITQLTLEYLVHFEILRYLKSEDQWSWAAHLST